MQSQTQFTRPNPKSNCGVMGTFSEAFLGKLRLLARRVEKHRSEAGV